MISQLNKDTCLRDSFLVHIIHLACSPMSDCLLLQKALTERMLRRIAFLRLQNQKQQRMVHQKEQMQETLCRIDLEHLKQKNIQSRELLQNIQKQLLCERMLVRKSQQGLNVYKVQIQNTGSIQDFILYSVLFPWRIPALFTSFG